MHLAKKLLLYFLLLWFPLQSVAAIASDPACKHASSHVDRLQTGIDEHCHAQAYRKKPEHDPAHVCVYCGVCVSSWPFAPPIAPAGVPIELDGAARAGLTRSSSFTDFIPEPPQRPPLRLG